MAGNGDYQFTSLAPSRYQVSVNASGFAAFTVNAELLTSQTLNLPVALVLAGSKQAVEVTGEAPIVNTSGNAESNDAGDKYSLSNCRWRAAA